MINSVSKLKPNKKCCRANQFSGIIQWLLSDIVLSSGKFCLLLFGRRRPRTSHAASDKQSWLYRTTTSKPPTHSRLLQKQNFISGIYIFIGMLGHRLPASSWNVSDFEFSDMYFIIWFYMSSIWQHITIGKTLRSRIPRLSLCKWNKHTSVNFFII